MSVTMNEKSCKNCRLNDSCCNGDCPISGYSNWQPIPDLQPVRSDADRIKAIRARIEDMQKKIQARMKKYSEQVGNFAKQEFMIAGAENTAIKSVLDLIDREMQS